MRKNNFSFSIYWLTSILIILFIPTLVIAKKITMVDLERINWRGNTWHYDFYSYYKALGFIILIYSSFILLFIQKLFKRINLKWTLIYIPLLVYIGGVIVSTWYSENLIISWRGFVDMFQGVWVLVGYALAVIIIYNMLTTEQEVHLLTAALSVSAVYIFVVGFSQYIGASIYEIPWIQKLIIPASERVGEVVLNLKNPPYIISSTLYNSNFVGSYGALLLPVFMFYCLSAKHLTHRLMAGMLSSMVFFLWLGSKSRAGYVGLFFAGIVLLIFLFKTVKNNWKGLTALMTVFILIFVLTNALSQNTLASEFDQLSLTQESSKLQSVPVRFEDLRFDDNRMSIVTSLDTLYVEAEEGRISFYDDQQNKLIPHEANGTYVFDNERYANYKVKFESVNYFRLYAYGRELIVYMTEAGLRLYDLGGELYVTEYPEHFKWLEGKERLFSGRGYIWMASIPLLKNAVLYGYGPGMYPVAFPQQDFVGKMNMGRARIVIEKPHNMYLLIGIENGVVALLALMLVFAIYFFKSLFLYRRIIPETLMEYMGIGIFLGITGYLVAGFFNDQIISVAPLFYILLGAGFSINEIVEKKQIKF
jgi:hypothetical protein